MEKTYVAIDLKSFYASVECVARNRNPLTTNLVVADESRTEKTICLAVTPSLKALGISGRPRLFEVVQQVAQVNALRRLRAPGQALCGSSTDADTLRDNPSLAVDYLVAPPHMAKYMRVSSEIYGIYLRYVAPEDIHVYSVDEVFIDATPYLHTYRTDGCGFARMLIREVLAQTGITATAGVAPNLYLAKVAMDIVAKKMAPDEYGARVAALDVRQYRELLWAHEPLTDFWRVGGGYARRLQHYGIRTMGDIARCSLGKPGEYWSEELLYKLFGVNAELLIDHAWGVEPCTIADIKAYRPENNSCCSSQVLSRPYRFGEAETVLREMADSLAMSLTEKGMVTDSLTITIGYDVSSLSGDTAYTGAVSTDRYGRRVPRHAHGTRRLPQAAASARLLTQTAVELYEAIVNRELLVRRISLGCPLLPAIGGAQPFEQLDLLADTDAQEALEREKHCQEAIVTIRRRFGKNAILRGSSYTDAGTARERNGQIGGHKA